MGAGARVPKQLMERSEEHARCAPCARVSVSTMIAAIAQNNRATFLKYQFGSSSNRSMHVRAGSVTSGCKRAQPPQRLSARARALQAVLLEAVPHGCGLAHGLLRRADTRDLHIKRAKGREERKSA